MTAKEKAKELICRMDVFLINDNNKYYAKQCALIAVDEIINNSLEYMGCKLEDGEIVYWKEVKQEIGNLWFI